MNQEVVDRAIDWWVSLRPVGWSLDQHLDNPGINTVDEKETALAEAVGAYMKASIKFYEYLQGCQ